MESWGCWDGLKVVVDEEKARGGLKEQVSRKSGHGQKSDASWLLQIGGETGIGGGLLLSFEHADMRIECEDTDISG